MQPSPPRSHAGSYSSNVNLAIENSSWSDEQQLQEMYMKRKSFAFNSDRWGGMGGGCWKGGVCGGEREASRRQVGVWGGSLLEGRWVGWGVGGVCLRALGWGTGGCLWGSCCLT